MVRINRVYTKAGDKGFTALVGGDRVSKSTLRIECYGTVDELNSTLGLVATALEQSPAKDTLLDVVRRIQNELFNLGSKLATEDAERRAKAPAVAERHVEALEQLIDQLNDELPALKSFILPGGGWTSSYFHLARTVCRRAERLVVALANEGDVDDVDLMYLNRLSDALFVFGRWAALSDQQEEPLWVPEQT